jgi:hypothetical protein
MRLRRELGAQIGLVELRWIQSAAAQHSVAIDTQISQTLIGQSD